MAGRIQKKVNDRFYFVLDEVEGSDNDSEDGTKQDANNLKNTNENIRGNKDCNGKTAEDKVLFIPSNNVVDLDIESEPREPECEGSANGNVPVVRISFRDNSIAGKHKHDVIRALNILLRNYKQVEIRDGNITEVQYWERNEEQNNTVSFSMDTTPDTHSSYSQVPKYFKGSQTILEETITTPKKTQSSTLNTCFNCRGSHSLRDCPLPKDRQAIAKNRTEFLGKNTRGPTRYHLDEVQKFSHLKPGVVSEQLRRALDISAEQLPSYIYRMRLLGYPPGWLEEAKISHSGVNMYDKSGQAILEEDEEEGEIVPEGAKDKYDVAKLINYPGFNVEPPEETLDEHENYNCPSWSETQTKEAMIKELGANCVQVYKKKKLVLPSSSTEDSSDSKRTLSSPTIEEMEAKKQKLLLELSNEDTSTDKASTPSYLKREPRTPKCIDLGTPILKSVSPFSKMPVQEKFSVNICDVINFENLPESTGKYEEMSHLIVKIRQTVGKPDLD